MYMHAEIPLFFFFNVYLFLVPLEVYAVVISWWQPPTCEPEHRELCLASLHYGRSGASLRTVHSSPRHCINEQSRSKKEQTPSTAPSHTCSLQPRLPARHQRSCRAPFRARRGDIWASSRHRLYHLLTFPLGFRITTCAELSYEVP